jgi:chromosome segregation ATPase
MSEPNYNETVIIPFLQKKTQDLLNTNMILEAHLLVEQSKYKTLEDKLKDVENTFNLKFSDVEESKRQLQQSLNQVTQNKNNEVGQQTQLVVQLQNKVEELRKTCEEQANTISINRNSIREQQAIIEDLKTQLNTANDKIEASAPKKKKSKIKESEDILDGDSY